MLRGWIAGWRLVVAMQIVTMPAEVGCSSSSTASSPFEGEPCVLLSGYACDHGAPDGGPLVTFDASTTWTCQADASNLTQTATGCTRAPSTSSGSLWCCP